MIDVRRDGSLWHLPGARRVIVRLSFGLGCSLLAAVACGHTPCDNPQAPAPREIALQPGREVVLEIPPGEYATLVEEAGGDLSYGLNEAPAQREIATWPPRLGLAAIPLGTHRLSLMLRAGQTPASARLHVDCASVERAQFHLRIESLHLSAIAQGKAAATLAEPLRQEAASSRDPHRRAWLLHLRANALLVAGLSAEAADAFVEASVAWSMLADPARAGVALYAAAEDASRIGAYDLAEQRFEQAVELLTRGAVAYYLLRADSARCLLLSRRGDLDGALACGERVSARMDDAGERYEAGILRISMANQWLKLGDLEAARRLLLHVDLHAAHLRPTLPARLNEAFGNLYLQTGELAAAAREFAQASVRYSQNGLPFQQATNDLRLARLAAMSGAYAEERLLLQSVIGALAESEFPEPSAAALLGLAANQLRADESSEALASARRAAALCAVVDQRECAERASMRLATIHLARGDIAATQAELESHTQPKLADSKRERGLVLAGIAALQGHHLEAFQRLEALADAESDASGFAIERADALLAMGKRAKARALLAKALRSGRAGVDPRAPVAIRLSQRVKLAELQAAWFDLLDMPAGALLPGALAAQLEDVLRATALAPPDTTESKRLLSYAARRALSEAILSGQSSDARSSFLSLLSVEGRASTASLPEQAWPLPEGVALVLPAVGRRDFHLLVKAAGRWHVCMRMARGSYAASVARFEAALAAAVVVDETEAEARDWFARIARCDALVAAAGHWLILTPSGARHLPWAWVASAGGGTEPALSWVFRVPSDATRGRPRPAAALVTSLDLNGADALPFAKAEAALVDAQLEAAGIKTQHAAPGDARGLLDASGQPGQWVHLIGHGNPPSRGPLSAGLWLRGKHGTELLPIPDIAAVPSRAGLVVLSACGAGPWVGSPADDSVQLAEAFVVAGASEVVAASNALSDSAAPAWVATFYEHLLRDGSAAVALREARRRLRESPHFRHPRFWAGLQHFAGSLQAAEPDLQSAKPGEVP